ncbi:unnamed protein product [Colias eurytheme]|nr:unnamed protein product [Colias eurytheme]
MAAEKKCCVPTCGSDTQILHKFPNPDKDMERFRIWLYRIGGEILALDNAYIYKYRKICHQHFEIQYHTRSKMLSPNAVPSLYLPGFKKSLPLADVTNVAAAYSYTEGISSALPSTSGFTKTVPLADVTTAKDSHCCTEEISAALPSSSGKQQTSQIEDRTKLNIQTPKRSTKKHTTNDGPRLYKEIQKLQKKNNSYKQRLKNANNLYNNTAFQNALSKFKRLAAIFTIMQFREIMKPKMGRRFTKEEKIMALSVYKRGPKCYKWLSKMFILPSPMTLSRMISRAALRPGINEKIFDQLKKKVQKMKDSEKLCTLIFDEMALTPHFDYNRKKDKVTGFVNYVGEPKKQIADHVLVYMIRGVVRNYKQPIYYSFCSCSTPKQVLAAQIELIIKKLHFIGFVVVATVCDQGTSNTAAINSLIEANREEHLRRNQVLREKVFTVDGQVVIPLYDVPHMLKGLRNNLLTKNLQYVINGESKVAKWEHIVELYHNNPTYKGLKIIKNLTESHCLKEKIPKMKVKYAAQLFSQTVGKTMGYLAEIGILSEESKNTADFIILLITYLTP